MIHCHLIAKLSPTQYYQLHTSVNNNKTTTEMLYVILKLQMEDVMGMSWGTAGLH